MIKSVALACLILSVGTSNVFSIETITKDSWKDICPKLEIIKRKVKNDSIKVTIKFPAEEECFKRLFAAHFYTTIQGHDEGLWISSEIKERRGFKEVSFSAPPEMLRNTTLQVFCGFSDAQRNDPKSIAYSGWIGNPIKLDLPSLLGLEVKATPNAIKNQAKTAEELEEENSRLKRLVAEQALDIDRLKEIRAQQ